MNIQVSDGYEDDRYIDLNQLQPVDQQCDRDGSTPEPKDQLLARYLRNELAEPDYPDRQSRGCAWH